MNDSKTSVVAIVITAIVALLAGFGVGKAVDRNKVAMDSSSTAMMAASPSPMADTKAGDLRATLVMYGNQHMHLTDTAIDAALDGNADATEMKNALVKNGQDISAAVGSVYGTDAQSQFQTIWNTHLNDFVTYAVASKKGDAAGKTAALADISTNYTMPISKLLSGANPNLPEATLESAFGDHVTMTAQMIDDHVAGDYAKEATDLYGADQHLEGLMSTLAGAIVKQYPAKF